jgi:flagellar biosynthesis GTPase FlhF
MELKRILARDSRSANEKAIQLYGNDVLIISSQRLDNQIELIVATDVDPAVSPAADSSLPNAESSSQTKAQMPFVPFSQLLNEVNANHDLG